MSDALSADHTLVTRHRSALMGTYGDPLLGIVSGSGSYVVDDAGTRYLDLLGGIAVNAVGHSHPRWVQAVAQQAAQLAHVSNFFATEPQVALAERLLDVADAPQGSRVFFANSGAEANEAALKLARVGGRRQVIALEGSFHGRTMGALSVTHKPAIREPFEPGVAGTTFVAPEDVEALRTAATEDLAAIILEPIQGESGVVPLSEAYLAAAREVADAHGALLIFDEVQTGIGRTGTWLAHQRGSVRPDVVTLAKSLAGGFPIGAVIAYGPAAGSALSKGSHGTTFGGNPLACAAALATLDIIEQEGLLDNVKTVSQFLVDTLSPLPGVREVRGEGLLLGIALEHAEAPDVVKDALADGFIINAPGPEVIRLAPPLNLSRAEAETFTDWWSEYAHGHWTGEQS